MSVVEARAAQSDPMSFDAVYAAHATSVFRAAYRVVQDAALADDIRQEVFLRLWSNPGHFDAERGQLGPYLTMLARSRAVDVWRSKGAADRAGERLAARATLDDRGLDLVVDAAEAGEQRSSLLRALALLPHSQREAIALAYWGGLSMPEIAQRTGIPLGTAKSRIRLGLQRLRVELDAA